MIPPLILLAAGKSSRMGSAKGLLDFHGQPWITQQIKSFADAGGQKIYIVLGYDCAKYFLMIPEFKSALDGAYEFLKAEVHCIINPIPYLGSFYSLQCGLRAALAAQETATMILPIDTPLLSIAGINQITSARTTKDFMVTIPEFESHRGHPVILHEPFMSMLVQVDPHSEQARLDLQIKQLDQKLIDYIYVNEPSIVYNLNSLSDWHAYLKNTLSI